jgi:hypothetical protein
MTAPKGRVIPLNLPRRLVCDVVHFGRKVPAVTVQRRMNLGPVLRARSALERRPGWVALFAKAFGLMAERHPAFRRAYLRWPWPRLYEHPFSTASIAFERDFDGEPSVFFAKIRQPEKQSLTLLESHLQRFKTAPLKSISCFRRALQIGRYPRFLRRFLWAVSLNLNGNKRAHRLGTFGVSVYSGLGAASLNPISPLTATVNYDVIHPDGTVDVRIIYDHRVMDGGTVARGLAHMERILNEDLVVELIALREEEPPASKFSGGMVA